MEKEFQHKGIATQLFMTVVSDLKFKDGIKEITVNSSPYAVNVYKNLGFKIIADERVKDGIRYTSMNYIL